MGMINKKYRLFYAVHIAVVLLASLFIFYGLKGSIQERLESLQSFSSHTIKLLVETGVFLLFGTFFALLSFRFLNVIPARKPESKNTSQNALLVLAWLFYFIALTLLVLKRWADKRFPMEQPEIVYFTLSHLQGGGVEISIFFESGKIAVICLFVALIFFLGIFIYEKKTQRYFLQTKISRLTSVNRLYLIFAVIILCVSCIDVYRDLNGKDYISVIQKYTKPAVDSAFYLSEYVTPKYENIVFPEKKKNLIIILVESLESSFSDKENGGLMDKNLIPHLTALARENLNFSNTEKIGGGSDLSGTGWTIAGMTGKFAGLPYNLLGDENHDCTYFLPNAVTLTDILAENDYRQLFIFGSDKHFAGRDALLETHGNVEIHDTEWYKENKMLPKNYSVFWGFEDKKLFDFAKYELENLSQESKPFMFGLLTVDTHMPTGYQCEICPSSEDMPLKNTILCTDFQVSSFIEWCKKQAWYADTVIAIMGDHLFMATEDTSPFSDNSYLTAHSLKTDLSGMESNPRRWLDIFINPVPQEDSSLTKNRKFSSFDMFPTILAALGCKIAGNKLGFGVNLFSEEKSLCERYSEEYINSEIMARNRQYESMEFISEE